MLSFGKSGQARGDTFQNDTSYELWLDPAQKSQAAREARRGIQTLVLCALFCVAIIGVGGEVENKFSELKRDYEENDQAWYDVFQKLEVLLAVENIALNTAEVALKLQKGIARDYETIKAREAALAVAHDSLIYKSVSRWFDTRALPMKTDPRAHRLISDLIAMPEAVLLVTLDGFAVEWAGGSVRNANEQRLRAARINLDAVSQRLSEIIRYLLVGASLVIIVMSILLWQRQIAPRIEELDSALRIVSQSEASLTEALHKLRQANMEQSDFTYALSHDLKTPTNTIRMLLSELNEETRGNRTEDSEVMISNLEKTAERMAQLIDDVVIYSQSVGADMPVEPVDLAHVLGEILQDATGDTSATGAEIRAGALPEIEGNRPQLKMLLNSLISNAVKFRHPERKPLIEIQPIDARTPEKIRFTVKDNGIGIPEKHQKHIFGLFKRLHAHNIYKGSGIGLAVCQRIVSNHGGEIEVKSIEGIGTVFTICLPRTQSAAPTDDTDTLW